MRNNRGHKDKEGNPQVCHLSYDDLTTKEAKEYDKKNLLQNKKAVFPELPNPLDPIYVKIKDLNEARNENLCPIAAIEVGIKFSF